MGLLIVLLSFLVMGYTDGIGMAMDAMRAAGGLPSRVMALLPSLLYVWFVVFSLPFGALCVRFGRRRVAVSALAVTAASLGVMGMSVSLPGVGCVVVFALIGISNTALQVALPPLLATFGARGTLSGRVMVCLAAKTGFAACLPLVFAAFACFGSYRTVFLAGAILAAVVSAGLAACPEGRAARPQTAGPGFAAFGLLADPLVLLAVGAFAAAICLDVWLNLSLPEMMKGVYGKAGTAVGWATTVYFVAKIPAMLAGAAFLSRHAPARLAVPSLVLIAAGMPVICCAPSLATFFLALVAVSFGSANVYGIIFGMLAQRYPNRLDALSSLLVMSISAGAIVSPVKTAWGL